MATVRERLDVLGIAPGLVDDRVHAALDKLAASERARKGLREALEQSAPDWLPTEFAELGEYIEKNCGEFAIRVTRARMALRADDEAGGGA